MSDSEINTNQFQFKVYNLPNIILINNNNKNIIFLAAIHFLNTIYETLL